VSLRALGMVLEIRSALKVRKSGDGSRRAQGGLWVRVVFACLARLQRWLIFALVPRPRRLSLAGC
jgi:hypothetical protein